MAISSAKEGREAIEALKLAKRKLSRLHYNRYWIARTPNEYIKLLKFHWTG